jgi:hypothetical protein
MISKKHVLSAIAGLAMFALPASALASHDYDWNDYRRPYSRHHYGSHHEWSRDHEQYAVRAIEDGHDEGEHCQSKPHERPPAFLCDDDGEDCEPNQGDWDDDDYTPSSSYYLAAPPAGYNLVQQRSWLLEHRRRAHYVLGLMRARHDSHAVHRISTIIRVLDARIAHDNELLAGERYPSPPVPDYPAQSRANYYYPAGPNPNY